MTIHFKTPCFLLLGAAAILSGCATTQPTAYQGLDSSEYLRPNEQSRRGHEPYVYNTPVDWKRYSTFIIEPVKIYRGPDNQFEKVSEEGKQELASYMHEQFDEKLRQKYTPVSSPQQDTLRIKMTLTGAKPTKQFIGTVMAHFVLDAGIWRLRTSWDLDRVPPPRARVAGALSLVLWAAIIVAGRLIAYNWFDCDHPLPRVVVTLTGCAQEQQ